MENRHGLSRSDAAIPATPPTRHLSSNLSTPGSTYGKEEDAIIFELTPRYIQAGIEGESHPQCRISFTPNGSRRHGDYRAWLPGNSHVSEDPDSSWGDGYELWRNDLKDFDLGLLNDNTHLLVDAGNARLVLVIPSLLPHPVLSTVLQTLFERWSFASVTLLPAPAMALVSAGLRSGLVIDIGWEETVVTAVYEFREVRSLRTTRAMKLLTSDVARWARHNFDSDHQIDLELIEELVRRISAYTARQELTGDWIRESSEKRHILLEWPTTKFTKSVSIDVADVLPVIWSSLLDSKGEDGHDDEELPLHKLIYNCLVALPPDVRGICMSRLVFVGYGFDIAVAPPSIMQSLNELVDARGWTEVSGQKVKKGRNEFTVSAQGTVQPVDARHDDNLLAEGSLVEERYLRDKAKHTQPILHGVVRQVDSLGPWVGASLLTSLKVKSFVEIQRERFLTQGLSGASRNTEVSVVQPRTNTLGLRSKPAERTSWTLSGWA